CVAWVDEQAAEQTVRVYPVHAEEKVFAVGFPMPVSCVAVAAGGRLFAVATSQAIALYDPHARRATATLTGHGGEIGDMAFDAAAMRLASVCRQDGTVRLWDTATGERLAAFDTGWQGVSRVALSSSGRWLAAMDYQGRVRLWDLAAVRRQLEEAGLDWETPVRR